MMQAGSSQPPTRRTTKVADSVAREIVHDIARQNLPPGSRLLPESEALARYRVSRGSLREALRILEDHGLVTIRPGPSGGPVVSALTPREYARTSTFYFHILGVTLRQLAEARVAIEPMVARLTAERKDPELIARLKDFLERGSADADADWVEEAIAFHEDLVSNSGNPILDMHARALQSLYADRVRTEAYSAPDREPVVYFHTEIAQAIVDGDGERAEQLTREHLEGFLEYATTRYPELLDEVVDWR